MLRRPRLPARNRSERWEDSMIRLLRDDSKRLIVVVATKRPHHVLPGWPATCPPPTSHHPSLRPSPRGARVCRLCACECSSSAGGRPRFEVFLDRQTTLLLMAVLDMTASRRKGGPSCRHPRGLSLGGQSISHVAADKTLPRPDVPRLPT